MDREENVEISRQPGRTTLRTRRDGGRLGLGPLAEGLS